MPTYATRKGGCGRVLIRRDCDPNLKARRFNPDKLTQVFNRVCREHGFEKAYEAVRASPCWDEADTECVKTLSVIVGLLLGYLISLRIEELLVQVAEVRWIAALLRKWPAARLMLGLLRPSAWIAQERAAVYDILTKINAIRPVE